MKPPGAAEENRQQRRVVADDTTAPNRLSSSAATPVGAAPNPRGQLRGVENGSGAICSSLRHA